MHIERKKKVYFVRLRFFFSCYHRSRSIIILALFNPPRPNPGRREKIKLNFYFHTSMWCPKKLKPFGAPQEIKFNLLFISIQLSEMHGAGRVNISKNVYKYIWWVQISEVRTIIYDLVRVEYQALFFNPLTTNASSHRNQSIDLLCKSIDWFPYDRDIGR